MLFLICDAVSIGNRMDASAVKDLQFEGFSVITSNVKTNCSSFHTITHLLYD